MNKLIKSAAALGAAFFFSTAAVADEALRRDAASLFGRLEPVSAAALAAPEVELGRALFWDERLSLDGKTSCGSCHFARDWGADRMQFSLDARGEFTSRHSPTIFNTMGQSSLRWLGDRRNGAHQAESSLTGSLGFSSKQAAIAALSKFHYADLFRAAYPAEGEPLNTENYGKAVAAYEATLVTPAPFDRFLAGDDTALNAQQKEGLRLFVSTGCGTCHAGPLLGGELFQRFGVTKEYWRETKSERIDVGRFAMTKKEEDKYVFRVPMLRNVAKTAPYFHDGSVERLDQAVRIMADLQFGRTLDEAETAAIVSFLDSLTGEVPAHYARPKKLPAE
jgi:cytochrome c peroxidase